MASKKEDIAISVKNVKKSFKLPKEKSNSLKSSIIHVFSKNKGYTIQHALKDISFDVKRGEFFGIVGRNGSGKSTLLKILAETYLPSSGSVTHYGKIVPFIELGVGFNPELTGRENVYLNGALLGMSRQQIEDKYDEIVDFAELHDFMDQKLKNYSSGMQVRLAFSVATRGNDADIILIDEVLAVGDADFQRKCYDYFKGLKKTDTTIVFVTHDMNAVREFCDRAILIEDGLITNSGRVNDVSDSYLQLFNTVGETEVKSVKDNSKRWGGGEIKITDVKVEAKTRFIELSYEIKANDDVDEFVLGYNFVDGNEKLLMGGNTLNSDNGKKLSIKKGEKKVIKFAIRNVLGSGAYTLNTTVRSGDSSTIFDKWDNITQIKIAKAESYYPIIAPSEMTVK